MVQTLTPFQQTLLPASFRGVQFFVVDTSVRAGQRVADHQYPFRQENYAEILGKQARIYNFDAFLVGDDVGTQYLTLLQAIETDDYATLVHPTLGPINAACIGAEFTQNVAGRFVECRLSFLEAGQIINPTNLEDTQANTINQASTAQVVTNDSFKSDASSGNLPDAGTANPADAGSGSPAPATSNASQASEQLNDAGDLNWQDVTTGNIA